MRVMEAVRYGGPETIEARELPTAEPKRHEVRVRVAAAGVNYIDIYQRSGLYPTREPVRLGLEGAGVIDAVGSAVRTLGVGQRVAWSDQPGSYATHVCISAERAIPVPDGVASKQAAAAMLQGMTAHYLTHDTFRLGPGDTCLVHAAAGGVGLLLCQMAKRLGARVIGTTSNESKEKLARAAGADHVILYTKRDFASEVRVLTGGKGVQVVYDSVGKDTWERSLASLATRGVLVLFGQASGPVPPIDPQLLAKGGSLTLTRASLFHYVETRRELEERAGAVLAMIRRGELTLRVDRELPLERAREAHELLEARATTGKLLLLPDTV